MRPCVQTPVPPRKKKKSCEQTRHQEDIYLNGKKTKKKKEL
jgi:hypothetical protein